MHMADALLSPAVGGGMWCASAAVVAYCSRRLRADPDDRRIALMGVLGAFLFTAQMINFAIPGTGSSGHLGGGLLLTILLGPYAAFLVVASVLIVQALFFADGGLLALGSNIFNLAFFPAFVGYPIYRLLCGSSPTNLRAGTAAGVAAIVSLQLGALAVVLETMASGISALPFRTFVSFMLPIHLAIGVVEGIVTAAIVTFVQNQKPGAATFAPASAGRSALPAIFLCAAVALGGVGAWFASSQPDGLEWSIAKATGAGTTDATRSDWTSALARVQSATAFLPHYGFPKQAGPHSNAAASVSDSARSDRAGTAVAGLIGGALALALATLAGFGLRHRERRSDR